jgi:molybdopterin-guanine dinucleotide biosynthesis protein A
MRKARLHVAFDNGHVGKFIDWRDAELNNTRVPTKVTQVSTDTPVTTDDNIEQLTHLLEEHMAFTAAIVISTKHGNPRRMEHLLILFERKVRNHADAIAAAQPSLQTTSPTAHSGVNLVPPDKS